MKSTYARELSETSYSNDTSEFRRDMKEGRQTVNKAASSTFWDWDNGLFSFFWRWQPEIKNDLRDGTSLWCIDSKLPNNKKKQKMPKDIGEFELMLEKIVKVRSRKYISKWGTISNLSHFFPAPKGEKDIRMVYDLTESGLNDALWAPRFWMPTMLNVIDCATHTSWYGDVDAGEMFLNFPIDLRI